MYVPSRISQWRKLSPPTCQWCSDYGRLSDQPQHSQSARPHCVALFMNEGPGDRGRVRALVPETNFATDNLAAVKDVPRAPMQSDRDRLGVGASIGPRRLATENSAGIAPKMILHCCRPYSRSRKSDQLAPEVEVAIRFPSMTIIS